MLSDVVPWNAISQGTNRGAEEDGGNRNMEEVVAVIEGYHDKGNGDHTHKSRTHSHCVPPNPYPNPDQSSLPWFPTSRSRKSPK